MKNINWLWRIILIFIVIGLIILSFKCGTEKSLDEYTTIFNNNTFEIVEKYPGILDITYKLNDTGVVLIVNNSSDRLKEYKYILDAHESNTISLTEGAGTYSIKLHNVKSDGNSTGIITKTFENIEVILNKEDENSVFNKNTTLVNFKDNTEIIDEVFKDTNDVDEIYVYFENMGYNYELADKISSGIITEYTVNISDTIREQRGICYDIATSMTAVLRYKGYKAQMVYGYVNNTYHAWVNVLLDGQWISYDPTIGKTSYDSNMSIYKIDEYH